MGSSRALPRVASHRAIEILLDDGRWRVGTIEARIVLLAGHLEVEQTREETDSIRSWRVLPVGPMQALVWSAVLNGIVAVPVMAMLMALATSGSVMGRFRISTGLTVGGWAATIVMGAASIGLLLSTLGLVF